MELKTFLKRLLKIVDIEKKKYIVDGRYECCV